MHYKKYLITKSENEAKNLLTTLSQKIQALQYLELITHNKYMDYKHGLKKDSTVKKAFRQKEKGGYFDHLTDCIQTTQPVMPIVIQGSPKKENNVTSEQSFSIITIEMSPLHPNVAPVTTITPTTPPAPPLPPFLGIPYLPFNARNETFI